MRSPEQTPHHRPVGPASPASGCIAQGANALVLAIARHWLALFNSAWAIYLILPILAPLLMQMGLYNPARLIYGLYAFTCHQLPDHSYFLFGANAVPLAPQLETAGMAATSNLFEARRFIGNEQIGYKVALCQRDVAIYGSVLASGLVYSFVRQRLPILPLRYYLLFLVPIAVDGLTQLFGLRESNWWLRSITGMIFGVASVWLLYPFINNAMQDIIEAEESRRL